MFESNDYLRFDLEHPRQAVFVTTKYNSCEKMEEGVDEVAAEMKETPGSWGHKESLTMDMSEPPFQLLPNSSTPE
jgi:hypothetical protein